MGKKHTGLFISKGGGIIPVSWLYYGDIKRHIFVPIPDLSLKLGIG